MRYYFDWDPTKAKINLRKHRVSFEQASTISLDQRMITIFDTEYTFHRQCPLRRNC
ncbi:MAG: BrnT family toxin [Deltaproteobacteria bacterium]|nr:BrnT family toxin [Deltaproteobacteria bacterium]